MLHHRHVFVETAQGRVNAGFSVLASADAADVSIRLRENGWAPYRLYLDHDERCWVAAVMDWKHAA